MHCAVRLSVAAAAKACVPLYECGEVAEWLKAHAWKACVRLKPYRGFESRSLRHQSAMLSMASSCSSSTPPRVRLASAAALNLLKSKISLCRNQRIRPQIVLLSPPSLPDAIDRDSS